MADGGAGGGFGVDGEGFEGFGVGADVGDADGGAGPADGVGDDLLDLGVVISWIRFVAGAEVEDAAVAALPGGAAAEDLAASEPRDEEELVGLGDAERFAIHFLLGYLEVFADALGDGVGGVDVPEEQVVPRRALKILA